jgi:assimilatory nitrate reductase catalytic subunit
VTRTTCPYCGVGCGLKAIAHAPLVLEGDKHHPANHGRLCSKGAALAQTVGLEGRLLSPLVNGRRTSWRSAINAVANGLRRVIDRHGPDAVAFYVSGQLLTEDYYAANKLMKGFIGSGNIDTNSRLCMASAVVAHTQAFGGDFVPGCYEDLDLADLVIFSGHNAAWTHPVLYRRMEAAKTQRGQRHVTIDPRRTDTADGADLHLPIAPQTDVRLWNGLLAYLVNVGAADHAYIAAHVSGFDQVKDALAAADQSPAAIAADCGVSEQHLLKFFTWFADTPRTVSLFSMGANQSAQGVAKGLAIINAHLATGRIGKAGACPFSITGQPNAMGGRETGAMATTLAAHMGFDQAERVARFWGAPAIARAPGLKAVDMFEAMHAGQIKAVWIMATNPAVSLPNANRVREALAHCPLVIVSDCVADTDTVAFAHIKLPALAWGEKDGTVTNSERRISRQRAILPAPGEARGDWRIIADVAAAMGYGAAFAWRSNADIFREYARLTDYENIDRLLDLSNLAGLSNASYDTLEPLQWPRGAQRLFTNGCFPTSDRRARMHTLEPHGPHEQPSARYPFALNTGRIRDQWHTMTRTARAPHLCRHVPEPYIEIHPHDADRAGVTDSALACVETAHGAAVAVVRVSDRQRPGALFMPMHWTEAFAPEGRANRLVSAARDPNSGQPEFKHTPARVYGYRETWCGFFIARTAHRPPAAQPVIWRRIPHFGAHLHEFAGRGDEKEREQVRHALLSDVKGERLHFEDASAGSLREAYIVHGKLDRVLFFGARLPPRTWLVEAFTRDLDDETRKWLLTGRMPGAKTDMSAIICACANVTADKINAAITAGARDLDGIGVATRAGTTCGSCRPEISRLLNQHEGARHAA